ncbi:MAG: GxxExxY protein [Geothermobacteraceae bacterium]
MYKETELTQKIIGCAYNVHNTLGAGFLEKVYENALRVEMESIGLRVAQQLPMQVRYKGTVVGEYLADLVVEDKVILELKALEKLSAIHEVQLKNYLCACGLELGLLLNFGQKVEIRRKFVSQTTARMQSS